MHPPEIFVSRDVMKQEQIKLRDLEDAQTSTF